MNDIKDLLKMYDKLKIMLCEIKKSDIMLSKQGNFVIILKVYRTYLHGHLYYFKYYNLITGEISYTSKYDDNERHELRTVYRLLY